MLGKRESNTGTRERAVVSVSRGLGPGSERRFSTAESRHQISLCRTGRVSAPTRLRCGSGHASDEACSEDPCMYCILHEGDAKIQYRNGSW